MEPGRVWKVGDIDTEHPSGRRHVVVGTETRICSEGHGEYVAQRLELCPRPVAKGVVGEFLRPFWTACPRCNAVAQTQADAREAEIRGGLTETQRLRAARFREAGVPPRFVHATLWNWQHGMDRQRAIWDWARTYIGQFDEALASGRSAVFLGGTGCGKTHLAIGLLRHVIEKGGRAYYTTVLDMLVRIKSSYRRGAGETERQAMDFFAGQDFLVIDEVGKQLDTEHEQAHFFAILNQRYNDQRPTLLVTNLPKLKFLDFVGAAVADRLREHGGALHVFDWDSQRSHKKPKEE